MLRKSVYKNKTYFFQKAILTKSDKINLLKKQYDAFLEEDKRRKERNENILQKLDKMRVCDKIVPYTSKVHYLAEACLTQPFNRYEPLLEPTKEYRISKSEPRPCIHTLSIPVKPVDTTLLNELSKAYILIPKLSQAAPVSLQERVKYDTRDVNDADWKSKYDILNKLKQSEKEELNTVDMVLKNETIDIDIKNQGNEDFGFEEKSKQLDTDSIISQHTHFKRNENNIQSTLELQNLADTILEDKRAEKESLENDNLAQDSEICTTYSKVPLLSNVQNIEETSLAYNSEQNSNNFNESYLAENEDHVSLAPSTDIDNVRSFVQDSEPENTMQTMNYPAEDCDEPANNTVNSNDDCNKAIAHVVQAAVINDSEVNNDGYYSQENNLGTYNYQSNDSNTPREINLNNNSDIMHSESTNELDDNYLVEAEQNENLEELKAEQISNSEGADFNSQSQIENINSKIDDKTVNEVYEGYQQPTAFVETVNVDHEAAIQDFETEQTNMFYTQPAQESQYGEGTVYDQSQESQDENYLQDEQYNNHYDAVLSDQVYSVEANDDEQVLQRYDQNYEQQYVGEEGQPPVVGHYDGSTTYSEQQQSYDNQHVYDNHTLQDQQLYEGQEHYEGVNYEVQQQDTQPFVGEPIYEGQQFEQLVKEQPIEETDKNDNLDIEQNVEKQLDKDDGLLQTQTSEQQLPLKKTQNIKK